METKLTPALEREIREADAKFAPTYIAALLAEIDRLREALTAQPTPNRTQISSSSGCARPGCVNPDDPEDVGNCSDCLHDGDEVRGALADGKKGPLCSGEGCAWLIDETTRAAILRLIARAEK